MLLGSDENKMNIWHVDAWMWCPSVRRWDTNWKMSIRCVFWGWYSPPLVETADAYSIHKRMPWGTETPYSYVLLNKTRLSSSEDLWSSACPQSFNSARLVELCHSIFTSHTCAHKLSVNVFLSHILESRKSIYRLSVVRWGQGTLIWVALQLPTVLGE